MPSEFIELGIESDVHDKEARDYFTERDVAEYNYTLTLNLTYQEEQQFQYGLPEDEQLEFWWDEEWYYGEGDVKMLELRHLEKYWTGWWWTWHELEVQEPYASKVWDPELGLRRSDLMKLWDEDYNASYCEFACKHINVKLFIMTYNKSWTLEESWDNDTLKLYTTYGIDWTYMGTNMWHIIFELLAFQNPQLGIPGIGGTILTVGVGLTLWASIALLAFAFITALLPFISGWRGS